ncbi:MAG: hypothetical protein HY077_00405 [Elusimicrobia bacterium]|nr:hypothetical protein [Elusimicrobiota bacterium]
MKADGWIVDLLKREVVNDWFDLRIYSEFDLQVCAYFWLRKYFDGERSTKWIVRAQPLVRNARGQIFKPDIAIFRNSILYDIIELKMFPGDLQHLPVLKDYKKLQHLKRELNLRHAYEVVCYDSDEKYHLPSRVKAPWMKNFLTPIFINFRRNENGRLRRDYAATRRRWEKFK